MIDVNSAQYKEDERRLQSLRTMVVLWLIVLALGVLLIPLMLVAGWVRSDTTRLESELLSLQSAMTDATSPSAEVLQLNAEVARVEQLVSSVLTMTVPTGANWPHIVEAVAQYDRIAIDLSSLTQTDDKIQLTGRATTNDAVVRYQQRLLDSGAFKDVVVISMATLPQPTPQAPTAEGATAPEPSSAVPVDLPFGNVEFVIDLVVGMSTP
ncbi:MAG: PilN domain-containing protein [Caldilineaceae bacterium]|nr:PilN domain-containing protein [Caldilineaceae bacterium]